jgi:hypothetical protein
LTPVTSSSPFCFGLPSVSPPLILPTVVFTICFSSYTLHITNPA